MNEIILETIIQFCQYCKQPSQAKAHTWCQVEVDRWQEENIDLKDEWFDFLYEEVDLFTSSNDSYLGFMPYMLHLNVSNKTISFNIASNQEHYTARALHTKYCESESEPRFHSPFKEHCYLETKYLRREHHE